METLVWSTGLHGGARLRRLLRLEGRLWNAGYLVGLCWSSSLQEGLGQGIEPRPLAPERIDHLSLGLLDDSPRLIVNELWVSGAESPGNPWSGC